MTMLDTGYKSLQIPRKRGRPRASVTRQCTADGCSKRAYKDNPYCPVCTRRYDRHGDPMITLTRGRKPRA